MSSPCPPLCRGRGRGACAACGFCLLFPLKIQHMLMELALRRHGCYIVCGYNAETIQTIPI